jgi:poly-gamma-glutamate capsule biosynthesis protein CapA/YwtB (metallophosphatase superfamily)
MKNRFMGSRVLARFMLLVVLVIAFTVSAIVPPQRAMAMNVPTVTLNFVGDILLASRIEDLIKAEGPMAPWAGVKDALTEADFTMGNLECAVGTKGSPMPDKQWTFRASPETLQGLKDAGVDVVSLANNHSLDFGVDCLLETVENVRQYGVIPAGAGINEEAARAPIILEKNGIKIGILATSMVIPVRQWAAEGDRPGLAVDYSTWNHNIVSRLRELNRQVDVTVVYLHWGEERETQPEDWVLRMESVLRREGADLIIGSHPHVLRGFRFDGKSLTAHSLGNFVFTTRLDVPACQIGAILRVTVSKKGIEQASVLPTKILFGKTVVMEGKEKADSLSNLNTLSRPFETYIDSSGELWEKPFSDMAGHWARFDVTRLARKGIVEGFEDGRYLPDKPITRAEFATTLARVISGKLKLGDADLEGFNPEEFALCDQSHWAYRYVVYLSKLGILPAEDTEWALDELCPREEVCTLLWRAAGMHDTTHVLGDSQENAGTSESHDPAESQDPIESQGPQEPQNSPGLTVQVDELNNAENPAAVLWCMEQGLIKGYDDGTLRLSSSITRAEAATVFLRVIDLGK